MNVKSRNYQRKWRYRKQLLPGWAEVLLALAVAVAAHLLFFGVFKYKDTAETETPGSSKVTLLNLPSLPEKQQEAMGKWVIWHDPKLAVRGDSPVGFTSFVPPKKRTEISVAEVKPRLDLPELTHKKYEEIKFPAVKVTGVPAVETPAAPLKTAPVVLDERGREMAVEIPEIKDPTPGESRYLLRKKGEFQVVEILKPIGKAQDRVAIQALLDAGIGGNRTITVIWMEQKK